MRARWPTVFHMSKVAKRSTCLGGAPLAAAGAGVAAALGEALFTAAAAAGAA